jgi:hypothetical protein
MPPPTYMWVSVEVSEVAFKHVCRQRSGRYRTQPALLSMACCRGIAVDRRPRRNAGDHLDDGRNRPHESQRVCSIPYCFGVGYGWVGY